jgi:Phage integrase, N-terminal SAM-like domain
MIHNPRDNLCNLQLKSSLTKVRDAIRVKHCSYCTEKTYVQWIRRYILFHTQGNRFSSDHPPTLPLGMSLAASIKEQVRRRAQYACEFCGITEIDAGGMLTIDHFQPRAKAGSDGLKNLSYVCIV